MSLLPSQINDMLRLYSRYSISKSPLIPGASPDSEGPGDAEDLSGVAKKQQVQRQTKMEVLKRIREKGIGGEERLQDTDH